MNQARVSPLQSRIIELRETAKLSWSLIARQVSAEFQKSVSAANCCTYYQRAKAALRGYQDIAAKQAEWDDPKNRAQRYSRRQWKKLPQAQQKALWRLSPYPPDPIQRALNPPKRAHKKTGEALDHAKESLAGLLRDRGNEEGARQVEASIESAPSDEPPEPTAMPVRPEPPRALLPTAVAMAAPKPVPASAESKARLVLDWNERAYDGSPIYRDRDGNPTDVVAGNGPRAKRLFLAGSNETVELAVARVFRRGETWLLRDTRDGAEREIEVENPHTYESESQYQIRRSVYLLDKRPRVSWLKILKIGQPLSSAGLTPKSNNDALAERERLKRESARMATSRSEFVKQMDAEREQERQAGNPQVDLSTLSAEELERLYFEQFR